MADLKALIKQGEGISVEFKECRRTLNRNVYKTVCAFLNRHGGTLLLGVSDAGEVTGIDLDSVEQMKKDFVTAINNPQKINPACYLSVDEVQIDGETVLHIFIPESSQVHRCNGRIIDRNEDGLLNTGEQAIFENTLLARFLMAWMEAPEERLISDDGWRVVSFLDELADLNRDGFIDPEENQTMITGLTDLHPVETEFDRRIDINGNGQVEQFEIVRAKRAGEERMIAVEEGVYPVQTPIDVFLDLNGDNLVSEEEIEKVLRFLVYGEEIMDSRSELFRLFDLDGNSELSEDEMIQGREYYLLPHPYNENFPFDGELDKNRDRFIAPDEIGIAAGVSAAGDIPNFMERLERLQWETARSQRTTEGEAARAEEEKRLESDFYTKLGTIQDKKLAIVDITLGTSKVDQESASGIMVFIENAFVNIGKVRVVDRQNITKIVKEYEFQQSDLTDEQTAVEIGKLAGADIIVIGSINFVGEKYYLNVKLISVETAEILGSSISDASGASEFYDMSNDAVYKLF